MTDTAVDIEKQSKYYAALVDEEDEEPDGHQPTTTTTTMAPHCTDSSDDLPLEFSYISETKTQLYNLSMLSIQILLEFIPQIVATVMVGHYYDGLSKDDEYISAIGLATIYMFVTGDSICWGLTTALFTLVPQAVGYATCDKPILEQPIVKNALAMHLQRSLLVTVIASIPCIIMQFFSGRLMTLLGEPPDIENYITNCTIALIPYILSSSIFSAIQRVCQALDLNGLLFFVTLLGAAMAFPLMYLLVYYLELGYIGATVSQSLIFTVVAILTVVLLCARGYSFLFNFKQYWPVLFTKKDMMCYLKLSAPGLFQNISEKLILQVIMVLSGYVGQNTNQETIALSTAVICYDLYLVMLALGLGICNAVNIQVGKYIGANNVEYAKKATKVGVFITLGACATVAVILISARKDITLIFTHNEETRHAMSYVIFAFLYFGVCLTCANFFKGLFRSVGRPAKTAQFVLMSNYLVAIPVLFIVLFVAKLREDLILGASCIWGCFGFGNTIAVIVMFVYISTKISWTGAAKRSMVEMANIQSLSESLVNSCNTKDSSV